MIYESKDGLLFTGIITLKKTDLNSSFVAQIFKYEDEFFFLCEYDGLEIESLFKEMATNTMAINNINRELLKKEILLKNTISQLTRTQELLEAKNQELKEISDEKSKILGVVAHDLRGPIGGISSLSNYIYSLIKGITPSQAAKNHEVKESLEFLEIIEDSSNYLLKLINDILDVSAIETGELTLNLEFINYVPFLNRVIAIDQELAKLKKITVLSQLEIEDSQFIYGDRIKISQVIHNLLQNAIKFSNPFGTIILKVEDDRDYITTKVIDDGEGIPESQRDRLFKIFSKAATAPTGGEKGHGLGLYISKKVIEAHKGIIGFEENTKRGSVFYFKLRKI